jgi:hypothetical protein
MDLQIIDVGTGIEISVIIYISTYRIKYGDVLVTITLIMRLFLMKFLNRICKTNKCSFRKEQETCLQECKRRDFLPFVECCRGGL